MNNYLRCTKCEVHDYVCKYVIRFTPTESSVGGTLLLKKQVFLLGDFNINFLNCEVHEYVCKDVIRFTPTESGVGGTLL